MKRQVAREVFKSSWYTKPDSRRELKRLARQRRVALERQQRKETVIEVTPCRTM